MRWRPHWNIRYIYDRINVLIDNRLHPHQPWLTKDAIALLENRLRPEYVGLEWGAGRSTLWFAKRLASLTSIEHNEDWLQKVKADLESRGVDNVKLLLLTKDSIDGNRPPYLSMVETIEQNSLDFIIIDGRLRDQCALIALSKLKPGGMLVIDNIERYLPSESHSPAARHIVDGYASEIWMQFAAFVKNWECVWTSNGVSDTAFWFKPVD